MNPTLEVTPLGGGCQALPCYHQAEQIYVVVTATLRIRSGHSTDSPIIGERKQGDQFMVLCVVQTGLDHWWASTSDCFGPTPHQWSAIQLGVTEFSKELEGPAGG